MTRKTSSAAVAILPNRFKSSLDRSNKRSRFTWTVLLHLAAGGFALVLQAITKQKVPTQQLIQNAIIAARKDTAP